MGIPLYYLNEDQDDYYYFYPINELRKDDNDHFCGENGLENEEDTDEKVGEIGSVIQNCDEGSNCGK